MGKRTSIDASHSVSPPAREFAGQERGVLGLGAQDFERHRAGRRVGIDRAFERAHPRDEERDFFFRSHASVRVAAIRVGAPREEPPKEGELHVVGGGGDPRREAVAVGARGGDQEPGGGPQRQRPAPCERNVATDFGLNADVFGEQVVRAPKRGEDRNTGELHVVAEEQAGVRADGVVAKVEGGDQIEVGDHDLLEAVGERVAPVGEREARLEVVKKARVQRPGRAIPARAPTRDRGSRE